MAFSWNFKPKAINGFNSQPVDTLAPQAQQPIQMSPVGMRGNELWRNKYNMPQTQRAAYMDEYEADEARKAMEPVLAQQANQGRIESLQNEIAELEKRIAENTARLQNFEGSADQIAALEARKINSSDPTSIWRWKVGQDESRRLTAAEKEKANSAALSNAQYEISNTLSSIIPNAGMDSPTQQRYLSILADLRTKAQTNGLPTEAIDAKIAEVKGGKVDGAEQTNREAATTDWKGLKNRPGLKSTDVRTFLASGANISPDDRKEAENLALSLEKKEADAADEKAMKDWAKATYNVDWSTLSDRMKQTYRRLWKGKKNG